MDVKHRGICSLLSSTILLLLLVLQVSAYQADDDVSNLFQEFDEIKEVKGDLKNDKNPFNTLSNTLSDGHSNKDHDHGHDYDNDHHHYHAQEGRSPRDGRKISDQEYEQHGHDHNEDRVADNDHNHSHENRGIDHIDHDHHDHDHPEHDHQGSNHQEHNHQDTDQEDHDHKDTNHEEEESHDHDNGLTENDHQHDNHDHAHKDHDHDNNTHDHKVHGHKDTDSKESVHQHIEHDHDHDEHDHKNHDSEDNVHQHIDPDHVHEDIDHDYAEHDHDEHDHKDHDSADNVHQHIDPDHVHEDIDHDYTEHDHDQHEFDYHDFDHYDHYDHYEHHHHHDQDGPRHSRREHDHEYFLKQNGQSGCGGQVQSGHKGHGHGSGTAVKLTSQIWLAALASILAISLVGVASVAFVPLLAGKRGEYVLQCLVSVAVGTLVGDAFIHLIPHSFLQDSHDAATTWKGFLATMVVVAFFTLDQILSLKGIGHGHSHAVPSQEPILDRPPSSSPPPYAYSDESGSLSQVSSSEPVLHDHTDHDHQVISKSSNTNMMVIIGDAVHNFADGIAIGAAFSMGYAPGLSTSIAVLCHELPHEIGDFAILIQNGMKTRTALFFNVVSSVFGIIGMCVGLLLGSAGEFSSWMLAGIIGVFLYVALVSMLPELRANSLSGIIFNISGMLGGAVLLLMIGLYEEALLNLLKL